ncbi:hypothetical protein J1N35_002832 [Gossypium stocksii]|uniref:PGG domain-containing protein n=1 Tax=Gossypium stocksii TaxID=47602 RepID=A0A9D3WLU9_9ROSI|nr:hypothetical protein J1N35_002832 [Gossypium stocksii]
MATANGHIEVVKELMNVDPELWSGVEGNENKTPFHFAAMKGRINVINEMLSRYGGMPPSFERIGRGRVGLSPPGGTCQDSYFPNPNNGTSGSEAHIAGTSIMGTKSEVTFALFMVFNSMDFSMSRSMINILTSKFPLQFELQICMVALFFTYNTAMTCIALSSILTWKLSAKLGLAQPKYTSKHTANFSRTRGKPENNIEGKTKTNANDIRYHS